MIDVDRRVFIASIVKTIYEMAPGFKPRNIDKIVNNLIEKLNSTDTRNKFGVTKVPTHFAIARLETDKELRDLITYALDQDEVRELNVSNNERKHGNIQTNKIVFVTATSAEPDIDDDFIDLDALAQNSFNEVIMQEQMREDCFLCKFAKEYPSMEPSDCDECKHCVLNPNYDYKRITHPIALIPRNSPKYIEECKKYGVNPHVLDL